MVAPNDSHPYRTAPEKSIGKEVTIDVGKLTVNVTTNNGIVYSFDLEGNGPLQNTWTQTNRYTTIKSYIVTAEMKLHSLLKESKDLGFMFLSDTGIIIPVHTINLIDRYLSVKEITWTVIEDFAAVDRASKY